MAGLRTSLSMTAQMYSGLEPELEGEEWSQFSGEGGGLDAGVLLDGW